MLLEEMKLAHRSCEDVNVSNVTDRDFTLALHAVTSTTALRRQ